MFLKPICQYASGFLFGRAYNAFRAYGGHDCGRRRKIAVSLILGKHALHSSKKIGGSSHRPSRQNFFRAKVERTRDVNALVLLLPERNIQIFNFFLRVNQQGFGMNRQRGCFLG